MAFNFHPMLCFLGLFGLSLASPLMSEDQGGQQQQQMQYVEPANAEELRGK